MPVETSVGILLKYAKESTLLYINSNFVLLPYGLDAESVNPVLKFLILYITISLCMIYYEYSKNGNVSILKFNPENTNLFSNSGFPHQFFKL